MQSCLQMTVTSVAAAVARWRRSVSTRYPTTPAAVSICAVCSKRSGNSVRLAHQVALWPFGRPWNPSRQKSWSDHAARIGRLVTIRPPRVARAGNPRQLKNPALPFNVPSVAMMLVKVQTRAFLSRQAASLCIIQGTQNTRSKQATSSP